MDLVAFFRLAARRAWIVVLAAGLGAAAALAWAAAQPTVYEATTPVRVFPVRTNDLGQTQALKALIQSYVLDVPTKEMARLAAVQMGIGEEEALALRSAIHAAADPNLYEVQVKARSGDPAAAERLSDQWARAFIAQRTAASRQLDPTDRIEATLRDSASHTVYSPRRKRLAAAGLALGALVGVLLALALEYLSQAVVRDTATAAALAGAPVLSAMPGARGRKPSRGGQALREAGRLADVVVRRGWPVLALAVLGAVAALVFSLLQTPEYRARTRIAVEPSRGSDWGQTQTIQETLRVYSADIATRRMAARVGEALQLDLPADAVLSWATVAPEPAAYEIQLDVRHPDPEVAAAVSRAWAETFIQERELANLSLDQRDRTLVRLRDDPATELWAPKKAINTAAGFVLGALVGLGVVFLLWWLAGRTVNSAGDARRAGRSRVLGTVPRRVRG